MPPESLDQRQDGLDQGIASLVFHLSRHLATALERRVAPFDVTAQQAALLIRASTTRDASPSRLASGLGTDNAGITRLLDRLEAKGLVARRTSPTDRRAIVIEPTDAGRALVPQLLPAFRGVTAQLLAGFSVQEAAVLQAMLRRLLSNVRSVEP